MKKSKLLTSVLALELSVIFSAFAVAQETTKVKDALKTKMQVQKTSIF